MSFSIDASLSNPIYGKSDTVQPPAVNIILGEYVVGAVATIGEADSVTMQAAISLLESNVGALENGVGRATAYIVESWSSGTEWYRKYSDDWVCQGGETKNATVSFPVEMRNTQYNVKCTFVNANTDVGKTGHWFATARATTGMERTYNTITASWAVEGYAKA
jgi:hypothetical protein